MATTGKGGRPRGRVGRVRLLARRGRTWDAHEVAEHLMSRQAQMVSGLQHKTPWAGLDRETLDSCFGHGAAVVVRVAVSGARPEWRDAADLERAQVAAFRHQALDQWKRIKARSREGDRFAVPFDPDRHASPDAPMDRLFEQPDLEAIRRDLLAELDDVPLRDFWRAVLLDGSSFKAAGDGLGLTKAQVMVRTRAGRSIFSAYLDRRETGELCRDRGVDIAAWRAGVADEHATERAEGHLASCYACSLVHQPTVGAFERGILGVAPVGLLLRLATRAGDLATLPATRWAEAGGGARVAAAGIAALSVAGATVGVESVDHGRDEPARKPHPTVRHVSSTQLETLRPAALARAPTRAAAAGPRLTAPKPKTTTRSQRHTLSSGPKTVAPAGSSSAPAASEFSFERTAPTSNTPSPPRPTTPPVPPEFSGP